MMRRTRGRRIALWIACSIAALVATAPAARDTAAGSGSRPAATPATHTMWNGSSVLFSASSDGVAGADGIRNPSNPICITPTTAAADVNTDCEGNAPHAEATIAVNPTDPDNIVASANDYELTLSPGGTVYETLYDRVRVSADHGATWTMVPLQQNAYGFTGDVAVAFDADGRAYMTTLGFTCNGPSCTDPDVVVATSTTKGTAWSPLTRVAAGSGVWSGAGVFNDKEYMAAWGHGNAVITWTVFTLGAHAAYINSAIYDSVTHDGGRTWSAPQPISGSAPFCTGAQGGTACDQDQFSTPAVGPDGSVHVVFENTDRFDPTAVDYAQDQYLAVQVDPATGAAMGAPLRVAQVVDGAYDYPANADGAATLHDSEFRTNSSGNITVDPTNAAHMALIWSDMRNSALPGSADAYNADPYAGTTNSDVVVSQSTDGGGTWSAPAALTLAGDQFQPWGAYDSSGRLRIGYYDRSADPSNRQYGYALATETAPGSLAFTTQALSTVFSDPTQNDRWFSGGLPNHATAAIGDYSNIAAGPSGGVVAVWTDLRNQTCFSGRCGAASDVFYAAAS